MRPARATLRLFGALAAAAVLAAAGCYAPNPANGTLKCGGDNHLTCPEGYTCASDGTCWKAGATGITGHAGSGGGGRDGGGGGTGGTSGTRDAACGTSTDAGRVDKFLGHWVFGAGATNVITCSDRPTTPQPTPLEGDYVDVTPGVGSDLTATYYCPWSLAVDNTGSSTILLAGQSCQTTAADNTRYTWHGVTFKIATSDGVCANLSATINADFTPTTGAAGTCTLAISGALTKQ